MRRPGPPVSSANPALWASESPPLQSPRAWVGHAMSAIRWSRVIAYFAIAGSGIAASCPRGKCRCGDTPWLVLYAWAILLAVSSTVCAFGALSDRWVGEYIGLAPLACPRCVRVLLPGPR